ncbi:TetR/AcrR family transcriptional regulator [Nocardia cyriacigeorgica]|uniref:QsdR family transcriptional regulator n=1 Tax=Nocardia cyriacigeorgica TaxID=135487 RepID=UPI001892D5E3|nr:QsdR family transcriptional regulator [Nocardia cyriacigeorgica]MBF6344449.1 TetR/AcrR family transcriptional regulator [Nocardia cyriacigeorgica]MBF6517905.1 TetR/AcrR family transcriptional regulator [Nocardia cyriacigeorgica]
MIATSEGRRAIDAATKLYLAGEPLDMSVLARTLGIGRATLYRHVGNRDELIATVLAEATERTYRKAIAAGSGAGAELILDVLERLMRAVSGSEPLLALTRREPQVFIRLALLPGVIESTSARLIAEMLDEQQRLGHLRLRMSSRVLADAIVRICDVHLYAPLLGGDVPQIDTALDIVALLLGYDRRPPEGHAE